MLVRVQHCMFRSWRVSSLPILYKPFTKQSMLEPLAPHGSGGRICQILSKCFKSFYKSFTKRCILKHLAPHCSGGRICQTFPNASNPLQILYKMEHSGASGSSWLRRPDLPDPFQRLQILYKSFTQRSILESLAPHGSGRSICQILSEGFKSFTNPLQNGAFWSFWRLMAQEAGSARSFPKASNSSQMLHKTVYSGAHGASWLRMPDLPDPLKASNP